MTDTLKVLATVPKVLATVPKVLATVAMVLVTIWLAFVGLVMVCIGIVDLVFLDSRGGFGLGPPPGFMGLECVGHGLFCTGLAWVVGRSAGAVGRSVGLNWGRRPERRGFEVKPLGPRPVLPADEQGPAGE